MVCWLVTAIAAQAATLDEIAGSYSDSYGKKLNLFKDSKSEWRAKLVTVNRTTRGDYYCSIEGKALLEREVLRIDSAKCSVVLQVTTDEIKVKNGFDKNKTKTNCNCGSAGSWFGDFKRSEKREKIIDFELPG